MLSRGSLQHLNVLPLSSHPQKPVVSILEVYQHRKWLIAAHDSPCRVCDADYPSLSPDFDRIRAPRIWIQMKGGGIVAGQKMLQLFSDSWSSPARAVHGEAVLCGALPARSRSSPIRPNGRHGCQQ
jgi:hypothetical protein